MVSLTLIRGGCFVPFVTVIIVSRRLTPYHTIFSFQNPFENSVGQGEIAGNQHFLLVPQCFLSFQRGAPRVSVVKCLTRNPGVLGSTHNVSYGIFPGIVVGQDTSEPQPSTGETCWGSLPSTALAFSLSITGLFIRQTY